MLKPKDFFVLKDSEHRKIFESVEFVWEVLKKLPDFLRRTLKPGILGEVSPLAVLQGEIFLGEGTVVEPEARLPDSPGGLYPRRLFDRRGSGCGPLHRDKIFCLAAGRVGGAFQLCG